MTTTAFFIPSVNLMGSGCLQDAASTIQSYGFKKALIVTDAVLNKIGMVAKVSELLGAHGVVSVVFDGAQPNPTVGNVEAGLKLLKENNCDFVISLGGGSPHDCAKGIALCASNGGNIREYEGLDQSKKPQLPLVSINTTAGTARDA